MFFCDNSEQSPSLTAAERSLPWKCLTALELPIDCPSEDKSKFSRKMHNIGSGNNLIDEMPPQGIIVRSISDMWQSQVNQNGIHHSISISHFPWRNHSDSTLMVSGVISPLPVMDPGANQPSHLLDFEFEHETLPGVDCSRSNASNSSCLLGGVSSLSQHKSMHSTQHNNHSIASHHNNTEFPHHAQALQHRSQSLVGPCLRNIPPHTQDVCNDMDIVDAPNSPLEDKIHSWFQRMDFDKPSCENGANFFSSSKEVNDVEEDFGCDARDFARRFLPKGIASSFLQYDMSHLSLNNSATPIQGANTLPCDSATALPTPTPCHPFRILPPFHRESSSTTTEKDLT